MAKITLAQLTIAFSISLSTQAAPAFAQDVFDSSPIGFYTGSQTMQGGSAEPPMLQGATNGTIGPQGTDEDSSTGMADDRVFHDRLISYKDMKIRACLLPPVACEEPVAPGVFPPIPQVPALPKPDIAHLDAAENNQKAKRIAKEHFARGKAFVKEEKLQRAASEFTEAVNQADDESQMREQISMFLQKQADMTSNAGGDRAANLLRLSLFFNRGSAAAAELLDDCLKDQGKKASDADYRVSLAEQFESEGNNCLAVAEWSQAVKLRNSPATHAKLASALVAANRDREALAELRKTVSMEWPESSKAERSACHRLLSEIFLRYSHEFRDDGAEATGVVLLENAAMDARRAVVLNPVDARANKLFLSIAQEATSLCPNEIDNHMWLGAAYLLKGDFRRADAEYAECGNLEPSDPRLGVAKTIYQVIRSNPSRSSKGMLAESIAKVNDLLKDDPDNVQLWNFLGRLHEQNADAKEASDCFAKAKQLYWSASK